MNKRGKTIVAIAIFSIVVLVVLLTMMIYNNFKPSKEMLSLNEYYNVSDDEVLIILQDTVYDKKALYKDGIVYIDYQTVRDLFNDKMYWDENENILTYTTPNEIIQAEVGSSDYMVSKSMIKSKLSSEYDIVKLSANNVYIAIDFVEQHSAMNYKFYSDPNRLLIEYIWDDFLFTDVIKSVELRSDANIKAPILTRLEAGDTLQLVNLSEVPKNKFTKVLTKDGVIGYVKNKNIKQSYYKKVESNYNSPEYTSLTRGGKVNLVFHQVFNNDSSSNLEYLIGQTKGVTTVSPTWYSIIDNQGNLSSLADKSYIKKANQLGIEVWALVDDFNTDISMFEILSHTSSREKLSNNLIEEAVQYKLNGINIDFEKITKDSGIHYIQFLRELSVKCRNNGIILSVDNYVPSAYTEHYYRHEQGEIVDYLIIMAYDEHYAGSDVAGPVASINFVKDAVKNTLELVPKEKVIVAIPFYTRLWKEDGTQLTSETLAMTPALTVLSDHNIEPEWDKETGHYYAEFEKDGLTYKMWQEDDKSIEEKLKAIHSGNVGGIAAWKLGLEKESIWNIIQKYID